MIKRVMALERKTSERPRTSAPRRLAPGRQSKRMRISHSFVLLRDAQLFNRSSKVSARGDRLAPTRSPPCANRCPAERVRLYRCFSFFFLFYFIYLYYFDRDNTLGTQYALHVLTSCYDCALRFFCTFSAPPSRIAVNRHRSPQCRTVYTREFFSSPIFTVSRVPVHGDTRSHVIP